MQLHRSQFRTNQKDVLKFDTIGHQIERKNPQQKTKVTHTVDHKSLNRRGTGALFANVKAN